MAAFRPSSGVTVTYVKFGIKNSAINSVEHLIDWDSSLPCQREDNNFPSRNRTFQIARVSVISAEEKREEESAEIIYQGNLDFGHPHVPQLNTPFFSRNSLNQEIRLIRKSKHAIGRMSRVSPRDMGYLLCPVETRSRFRFPRKGSMSQKNRCVAVQRRRPM